MKLKNAPIVEAVVDLDCDMPPGFDLGAAEKATRDSFQAQYPKFRSLFLEQHRIEAKGDQPSMHSANRAIQALQFFQDDGKQLVQVRAQGFSFNRLAPYTNLGDYLPEIKRAWHLFAGLTSPLQIRVVRLRYINRILLPLTKGQLKLEDYVKMSPQLADDKLTLTGFLDQYAAVEAGTGHEVNVVVTSQPPEAEQVAIIFDNYVTSATRTEPQNWTWIVGKIETLKNK